MLTTKHVYLLCLLALCTFSGMGQTLTCTFQFTGSGTLGATTFTNAAITVTTVGDLANRQSSTIETSLLSGSASVLISGIGTFQFTVPIVVEAINQTPNVPGAAVTEEFRFGIPGQPLVDGTIQVPSLWNMAGSFGPVLIPRGYLFEWRYQPITTTGGTLNIYDANPAITFQASVSGTPTPVLSRTGVFSHIAAGGGWSTVITLVNSSSSAVSVAVALHNEDGSAMALPVTTSQHGVPDTSTAATLTATIGPRATLVISAGDGAPSTSVGWADVSSTRPVGGFAIFRQTSQNGPSSEGTAPLQTQFPTTITLPYDDTAGFVMGAALANLSTTPVNIAATVWDDSGDQLGVQNIVIAGSGHTSFALPVQIPLTVGKRGIVQFQSTGGLAGLGLRFSPFGTFTSVPTI